MQDVPCDLLDVDKEKEEDPDVRMTQDDEDRHVMPDNEFYDGEKDQDMDSGD